MRINGFEQDTDITYLADANVDVVGTLTFADAAETETLKNYRVQLLDADRNVLADSGLLYTNNYNNINNFSYTLNYGLIEGDSYILIIEYTTQNLYYEKKEYNFLAIQTYADKLDADLKYVLDEANAAIGINIKAKEAVKPIVGDITIRRTSSESNFTV